MENLFCFLEQYIKLTDEDRKIVEESNQVSHFKKNDIIKPLHSETSKNYFVLSGLIYSQIYYSNVQTIGDFHFDGQPVYTPSGEEEGRSDYELICLEDTVVTVGDEDSVEHLIRKFPQFERVCRMHAEEKLSKTSHFFNKLKSLPAPEKYYFAVKERPELQDRVPQYLLAKYLGMTQETLSRARRETLNRSK